MNNNPDESNSKKTQKVVFPSDIMGNEEQFRPSVGSYKENHEIRSAVFGEQFIDKNKYQAMVFALPKGAVIPRRYDTVIASVFKVSRSSVKLNINYVNNKPVIPSSSAIMHISDASREYINEIDDYYCAGDIIRATVIDSKSYPLQLECKKNDSGVIFTTCVKCGEHVEKIKRNLLKCTSCNWKQSRNTAIDFGNFTMPT